MKIIDVGNYDLCLMYLMQGMVHRLRFLNHRKKLKQAQSRIVVAKPSDTFVDAATESHITSGKTDAAFYVSFERENVTPKTPTKTPPAVASSSSVKAETKASKSSLPPRYGGDVASNEKIGHRSTAKRTQPVGPGQYKHHTQRDLSIEFVLPSSFPKDANSLTKSFSTGNCSPSIKQPRRTTRLKICDEIMETRKQGEARLGAEMLGKVREALRNGISLNEVNKILASDKHADDIRLVKRLLYLEDAYYG